MGNFSFYFQEGIYHIADWKGYDHILFVTALCIPYLLQDWKLVLALVTAFTIGHSITLALSLLNQILIPSKWIEFLIPVTIVITAFETLLVKNQNRSYNKWRYAAALLFGCIHGMGFSNYLKSMLGSTGNIITELLAFNLGLEAGQLMIITIILILTFIFVQLLKIPKRDWTVFVCGGIISLSIIMAIERQPF
jgi:hypothetical protein